MRGGKSGVWSEVTTPREAVEAHFPTLARDGYAITSPRDDKYNCVAWVVRDQGRWWEPGLDGAYWPREIDEDELDEGDLEEYLTVFESYGFRRCADGELEDGVEKIAVHAAEGMFSHVAFQRPDGDWSSKLGMLNDVRYECVASLCGGGSQYPGVSVFMSRTRQAHALADSASGLLLP